MKLLHVLVLVCSLGISRTSDEIPDFDFDDDKSGQEEYYYVQEGEDQMMLPSQTVVKYEKPTNFKAFLEDDFDDDVDFNEDSIPNFKEKEERMRKIMLRVFSNKELKRKFAEILPLLRVMSKTQKATLAALITAQVNSKDGHTLSLDQVKTMFGSRPELMLPLVLDIANMIRTVAKKESMFGVKYPENEKIPSNQLLRRSFQLRSEPHGFRMNTVENQNSFMTDSRLIVEEEGRSLAPHERPHYEKLVQSMPKHQAISDKLTFHERKLNMTAFNSTKSHVDQLAMASDGPIPVTLPKSTPFKVEPKKINRNMTMEEVEELALSSLNGTEFITGQNSNATEGLPTPEMLIAGHLKSKGQIAKNGFNPNEKCEYFSGGVCIKADNYPMTQIMGSIKRNRHAMHAILAEYVDKPEEDNKIQNEKGQIQAFSQKLRKREDEASKEGGSMCPSIIRYARPQKARSATGEWKYIVNTGQHTQTLRLEKCSSPQDSCTYLTDNFRSRCIQVYNYHRLLSWDTARGLHVDIFKVPTCCSCHIDGYRETFPPLTHTYNNHKQEEYHSKDDASLAASHHIRNTHYSTLKIDEDSNENDDENIAYQFSNGFKRMPKPNKYENIVRIPNLPPKQTQRQKVTSKKSPFAPSPTLDTFLSPPPSLDFSFKRGPQLDTSPNRINQNRRPQRKNSNDQSIAESDIRINQVTVLPPPKLNRIPDKIRKPIIRSTPPTTTPRTFYETTFQPHKVNFRLPNTVTSSQPPPPTKKEGGNNKRINYNYHPIIEFFEDEEEPEVDIEAMDRIGLNSNRNNWKPLLNRPRPH